MKIVPPGMPFESALMRGLLGRIEDPKYLKWVRTLPCVCCGSPGEVAHHPIDVGFKGMGSKVPDYWVIPMTDRCHQRLHQDVRAWEEDFGPQLKHSVLTLTRYMMENK